VKNLFISILLLLMLACNGTNSGEGDGPEKDKIEDDDEIAASVPISGKAEKGPFLKDTDITATAYNLNWDQSDFPKEGSTEHDDGSYQIYSTVSGEFVRIRIEGESYNEVEDRYDWVSLRDISRNDEATKNLNPLTHLLDMVSFDYCRDLSHEFYRQGDDCLILAKSEILTYLGLQDHGVNFNKMSLQGDSTSDAQMQVFSFYIASGRTGPEQNDHLREVANGVLGNNLTLKQEIFDFMWSMPFKKYSDNLINKYTELGVSAGRPPFWSLPNVPGYYADLLGRTPTVLDSVNTGFTVIGGLDTPDFNIMAYPVEFTSDNPKYIALNLTGTLSIWTVGVHADGYSMPASKVADLSVLNEVLLDDPVTLQYNYSIDGNVSIGQYFIVSVFPSNTQPSKLTQGDMTPFGKNMASTDMVDWIGPGNVTGWYTRSIVYVSYD
jgi:hypothetical protein